MEDKSNCGEVRKSNGASGSDLETFIASQMQQQQRASKELDNLDIVKRDSFIARALSESRRMNKEIEKSQEKRDRLYAEFGEVRMNDWRNEHSAEALPQSANMLHEDTSLEHQSSGT